MSNHHLQSLLSSVSLDTQQVNSLSSSKWLQFLKSLARPFRILSVVSCLLTTQFGIAHAESVDGSPYSQLANQKNVIFHRLSTEDGLSQATVTAITQDQNGFIWLGTIEGLNRYDGYTFENFYHLKDKEGSISHHSIWDILCDSRGDIWIGTDSGLNRYNEQSSSFEAIHLDGELNPGPVKVYTLFEDSKGRMWVGTGIGLTLRSQTGQFVHFRYEPNVEGSIGAGGVRAIYEDTAGQVWIGTEDSGLFKFNEVTGHFEPATSTVLRNRYIREIIEDNLGNLWVSTNGGGVIIFDSKSGKAKQYQFEKSNVHTIGANRVRALLKDQQGNIWVGSDEGLNLWRPETQDFIRFNTDPTNIHSLSDNTVMELFQDTGGVIWVGTLNGVSKWNGSVDSFPHFRQDAKAGTGLTSNIITSFAESSNHDVWIGTINGLTRFDAMSGDFLPFSPKNMGLSDGRVMSLATYQNELWVGTMTGGVNVVKDDVVIKNMKHEPADPNSISSNAVSNIYVDSKGQLWLTTYGGGVNRYLGDGRFRRYPDPGNPAGQFSELRTVSIIEAPNGELWIATDGGGVIILDPTTGDTRNLRHTPEELGSISSNNVISLMVAHGTIWVGTRDKGMNRYNPATKSFERFTKADGLASDFVYGMQNDKLGRIWISGGKGLSVYDPRTEQFIQYDSSHGLQSDDFNSGASFTLSDGSFLFGGIKGFNAFYPERIKGNGYFPKIKLTKFSKFNKVIRLENPVYQQKEIHLDYSDSVIGFEFAAMDFTSPKKNQFRYLLEGFDRDWVEANGTHQVTYTNLDPGRYTFRVTGSNNDGVWNNQGSSIKLIVSPPIWATWWAYLVYIIVALGLLRWVLTANESRLRREAEKRYSDRLQLYIESLEEATDCVLIADANKSLLYANHAIKDILSIRPEDAEDNSIMSLLFSSTDDADQAMEGLQAHGRWHGEVSSEHGGTSSTTEITIAAVRDDNNKETAFVSIARDVTERKRVEAELEQHRENLQVMVDEKTQALTHEISENKVYQVELADSLKEKELLLKEVHHRVKNNMQVISSLLNIQAETIGDDRFSELLGESQQRIKSMALIHENLYQSDNLLEIDFNDYINMLANSLHRFYAVSSVAISLDIQVDDVALDIETAVPCGLIINELISNSLKHAFKGKEGRGTISVHFKHVSCRYVLEIKDDGIGLPKDFTLDSTTSMGMEIVSILTQQLDGRLQFDSTSGARFEISFPRKNKNG